MGDLSYERRRNFLLKTMKKQTDQWLKEDQYEEWQKKNKPKKSYTFIPKRAIRTKDIYNKECLNSYYQYP
jgi:hypothetical protein